MPEQHLCEMPTAPTTPDYICPQCGKWWSVSGTSGGLAWREVSQGRPDPDIFGGHK